MCERFESGYLETMAPFWLRTIYFQRLARELAKLGARRVLDVGCADGALVNAMEKGGIDAYGVDISSYAIGLSPIKERLILADVEGTSLPFADKCFDLVTAIEVLEHLRNPEKVIFEISRILKPRGFFFMTSPSPMVERLRGKFIRLSPSWKKDNTHISVLSQAAWIKLLQRHGFKQVSPSKHGLEYSSLDALKNELIMKLFYEHIVFGPWARRHKLHKMGTLGKMVKTILLLGDFFAALPIKLCPHVTIFATKTERNSKRS